MQIRFAASLLLFCFAVPVYAAKPALPATPFAAGEPVELLFAQQEIAVDVPDHGAPAMQFGLLGALVGTAITNSAVKRGEARVADLRNVLLGYPFNERMERALRGKLVANAILREDDVRVLHTTWNPEDATSADDGRVLILTPRYAIAGGFDELSVSLTLGHAERSRRDNGKTRQKLLFSRTYAFKFPLAEHSADGYDDYATYWTGLGREQLGLLLDEGIDQVTDMLVYDLSADGRSEAELPNRRMVGTVGASEFAGRAVRSGDGWIWVRSGPAALKTLVGHHPVDAAILSKLVARAAARDTPAVDAGATPGAAPAEAVVSADDDEAAAAVPEETAAPAAGSASP